jgi:hypothetical protein
MTRAKQERYFAGIPLRVWLDRRLTRRHLIVLGIIAAHDQFNANGQGCTASQRRIAELAGYYETHVSAAIGDLRDWGYLTSELRGRGRQRVHRIVWQNEVDKCFWAPTKRTGREVFGAAQLPAHGKLEAANLPPTVSSTYRNEEVQLTDSREKIGTSDSGDNDLDRVTYVLTESLTYSAEAGGFAAKSKNLNGVEDRTDCAKARNRDRTFVSIENTLPPAKRRRCPATPITC